jgi:predicted membrane protein
MSLILIGGVFLLTDIPGVGPQMENYIWPLLLIMLGLMLVLRALLKKNDESFWNTEGIQSVSGGEDDIEIVSIFGGSKRKIFSKKFRGGEVVGIFGGAELDFTQADIEGKATLEVTNIFGGTKIIVPANWHIKSDITTIMGGMDDKRPNTDTAGSDEKTLVLTGFCMFGGVDIRSYNN